MLKMAALVKLGGESFYEGVNGAFEKAASLIQSTVRVSSLAGRLIFLMVWPPSSCVDIATLIAA